jgi:hypothetical protein
VTQDRLDTVAETPRSGDRSGLTPTQGGNRKGSTIARIAGWLSVTCGVAGVVISLAAIAGVWVVQSQVAAEIVAMTDTVDSMLGRAESALAQVETVSTAFKGESSNLASAARASLGAAPWGGRPSTT